MPPMMLCYLHWYGSLVSLPLGDCTEGGEQLDEGLCGRRECVAREREDSNLWR